MSAAELIRFCDAAEDVAMEHVAWCLQHGYGLREIAESIGVEINEAAGIDDVVSAVADAWMACSRA